MLVDEVLALKAACVQALSLTGGIISIKVVFHDEDHFVFRGKGVIRFAKHPPCCFIVKIKQASTYVV